MKKIAIFTSSESDATLELARSLEGDERFHIDIAFTDGGQDNAMRLRQSGLIVNEITADTLALQQETLAERLADNGIDLIVTDRFSMPLPPAIAQRWEGRTLRLEDNPEIFKKGVDEEWAETLKLNFDPSAVPPPVPEKQSHPTPQAPECAYGQPATAKYNTATEGDRQTPPPPMPQNYLLWSILATIFCCLPLGIVSIIFSAQVSGKYFAGDYEGARRASRYAQYWIIASIVVGVVTATLYIPLSLLG